MSRILLDEKPSKLSECPFNSENYHLGCILYGEKFTAPCYYEGEIDFDLCFYCKSRN